jgi:hypothetical protein
MKKRALIVSICAAAFLITTPLLFGEETDRVLSAEKLLEVLANVRNWTAETLEFRKSTPDLEPKEILEQANAIRRKFDPVMVLMATTEPAAEYRHAATILLMGTKGVELALWHYIFAVVAGVDNSKTYGDTLLQVAVSQINDADKLFSSP